MGLRVIGGEHKGKKLSSLQAKGTRPTAARMREALFNMLSHRIRGAAVLDLFAGTGALGIEALSRGADTAVFVENNKAALSVIQKNIQSCHLEDRSTLIRWNILVNLNCLKSTALSFDLVFLDPPYQTGAIPKSMQHLKRSSVLKNGAQIVIEHASRECVPEPLSGFEISRQRRYGDTSFTFCHYITPHEKG